jgi:hypothetical protein
MKPQGKRKKKCAKVWYVTVKIVDSKSPISMVLMSVLDLLRISSFLLILALTPDETLDESDPFSYE